MSIEYSNSHERDNCLVERADYNPCIPDQFKDIIPGRTARYRRIGKVRTRRRRKLRPVGTVSLRKFENGRPNDVYCNKWRPSAHLLFHEVMLTYFMLLYPDAQKVRRGPFVDKRIRPDSEFTLGDMRFFTEFDTGEEDHPQVRKKWDRNYRGVVPGYKFDYLLVVTMSEERLPTLIAKAKKVANVALFTTLDAVCEQPHGVVWTDHSGNQVAIPKPKREGE